MSDVVGAIDLPVEAASAAKARRFVTSRLSGRAIAEDVVDVAILLTSELVTNAVLHAGTPVTVHVAIGEHRLRVEVDDDDASPPSLRNYGPDAVTGRGLGLLSTLATSWGVQARAHGKTVWFEIPLRVPEAPAAAGEREVERPVLDGDAPPPAAAPAGMPVTEVRILGVPRDVYRAAQAHNDSLLREFAFLSMKSPPSKASVPARLLELTEEIRARFPGESAASRRAVQEALARGETTLDLTLLVSPDVVPFAVQLVELLDEADRFCRDGQLLTLTATEEVLRFRAWYLQEFITQLGGGEPTPWPGAP